MSYRPAAGLYDALHNFETRFRFRDTYPVHKKLRFDAPGIDDIYDWITTKIQLPDHGDILDAGCGVGFGTRRMAEQCDSSVVGVSVSPAEICTARRAATRSTAADRLTFRQSDFADLQPSTFDLIVAVESLKHAEDLSTTLAALYAAIRSGGQIVIVEDCFEGEPASPDAIQLAKYWGLSRLYSAADYLALEGQGRYQLSDLTPFIGRPGWFSRLRQHFVRGASRLSRKQSASSVFAAFAGGVHLERLYAAGDMRYQAMIISL